MLWNSFLLKLVTYVVRTFLKHVKKIEKKNMKLKTTGIVSFIILVIKMITGHLATRKSCHQEKSPHHQKKLFYVV